MPNIFISTLKTAKSNRNTEQALSSPNSWWCQGQLSNLEQKWKTYNRIRYLTVKVLLLKTRSWIGFSTFCLSISLSRSSSRSSRMLPMQIMKSKKGSRPALCPGEFSWTNEPSHSLEFVYLYSKDMISVVPTARNLRETVRITHRLIFKKKKKQKEHFIWISLINNFTLTIQCNNIDRRNSWKGSL